MRKVGSGDGGSRVGRKRQSPSSDMDLSDGEDDRIEQMMAHHQQRDVGDWGDASGSSRSKDRYARRDARRDDHRKRRRDESASDAFQVDTHGYGVDNDNDDKPLPPLAATPSTSTKREDGLLLPGNVEVQEEGAEDGEPGPDGEADGQEGELGDFVTLDADRSGVTRYWEVEEKELRNALEDCPTCGQRGHDKKSCPHTQCLACGALDEHTTRECPLSLSCYRCGGTGHKAFECKKPRTQGRQGWKQCQRCGATTHVETNCPTHWRIYCYNDPDEYRQERRRRFVGRETSQKRVSTPSRGDFDYRSESESSSSGSAEEEGARPDSPDEPPWDWDPATRWCYNCAAKDNHWGDDCPLPRCNPTRTQGDPSAYSEYMASSGPHARFLPPPPPPDALAYRNDLRSASQYDRFDAGPRASMHVYDPQREAMESVDRLFDRHGPGASRRRDAMRRGRGRADEEPLRAPKPSERRSGHGSKAERYRSEATKVRPEAAPVTVTTSNGTSTTKSKPDNLIDRIGSGERKEINKAKKHKIDEPIKKMNGRAAAIGVGQPDKEKLQKKPDEQDRSEASLRPRSIRLLNKDAVKAAGLSPAQQRQQRKLENREKMKMDFERGQERRLEKGKVQEHAEHEKKWAELQRTWRKKEEKTVKEEKRRRMKEKMNKKKKA